jgi:hypothetical protein
MFWQDHGVVSDTLPPGFHGENHWYTDSIVAYETRLLTKLASYKGANRT